MESSDDKQYTILDFIAKKDYFMRVCSNRTTTFSSKYNLWVKHPEAAEDLFSDTVLILVEEVFNDKYKFKFNNEVMFEAFCNTIIKRTVSRGLNTKNYQLRANTIYFSSIFEQNKEEDRDDTYEDKFLFKYLCQYPQVFVDYKENVDIQTYIKDLDRLQKKLVYKSYLGFTQKELGEEMGIGKSAISERFDTIKQKLKKTELCQN